MIEAGARIEPDEIISAPGRRTIAGLPLEVGLEAPAVTAGDVWLFEPKTKVLIAGDLVTLPARPAATPSGWPNASDPPDSSWPRVGRNWRTRVFSATAP